MTEIRWGLIGASDIAATRVIPALRASGGTVAHVCSGSAEHARRYAAANDIPRHGTDLEALLDSDVTAVYISSRNDVHAQQALAAARAGKHILLEKPMATTWADAEAVVAACESEGVLLAVNHHLPAAGTHRTISRLVREGAIGRPLSVSIRHAVMLPERLRGWRLSAEPGAGVILDITVHDAAVLNALLPSTAEEVAAVAVRQGPWAAQAEDAAMVTIRYGHDVLAQTHDAFTSAFTTTRLEVSGELGSITADGVMTQEPTGQVYLRDANGIRELEVTDRRDLYAIAIGEFVSALGGEGAPAVSGREGLAAYAVAQAALDSARSGSHVRVRQLAATPRSTAPPHLPPR